jgi:hypothetical protein
LIGVWNVSLVVFSPRIYGICTALLAQLAGGFNRLEKFADYLLHTLAMEMGIATLGPFLPSPFGWPLPVGATDAKMTLQQIVPEAPLSS